MSSTIPHALTSDILQALSDGRLADASALLLRNEQIFVGDPDYWRLRVRTSLASAGVTGLDALLPDMLRLGPKDSALYLEVAGLCLRLGRRQSARAMAKRAADSASRDDALALDAIGSLLLRCGGEEAGLALCRQAHAMDPGNRQYLYHRALAERMIGDLTGAEATLDQLLGAHPDHAEAQYIRSGLRTQSSISNHVAELEACLGRVGEDRAAHIHLTFALAKELEDLAAFERSFVVLKQGCDLRRGAMDYDVSNDIAAIENIMRQFNADALSAADGKGRGTGNIFIVGLPRSGTTLLERMLDAHSHIVGAGELDAFPAAVVEGVHRVEGRAVDKIAFAQASLKIDPAWLADRYVAEATAPERGFIADKLPLNYLYIGLIRRALPAAKLILLERDPRDCCYAMYKTLFADAYPFSYDLQEIGAYFLAYQSLMEHWKALLGPDLHVMNYERLVSDPRTELGNALAFIGLEWEENCLDFHRNEGAVTSASAVQVRSPLNRRSIENWRHYERELAPLSRILRQ